ncbi:MAG: TIGR01777 family oxidoreductase [Chthoniobacterales bacterium]
MRIGITGASGFIASHLIPRLREKGHTCFAFSRNSSRQVDGCEETRALSGHASPDLRGLDALVNLAGESIQGFWTEKKKQRIRASRINLTRALVAALPDSAVRILVSGSATGFYGDRGNEVLPESAPRGEGFLADVSVDWENAALAAEQHNVRVALLRTGFVVAANGGAMDKIRPLFRLGLGGRLGSGQQWMPWVHLDDVCGLCVHLLENDSLRGPFNAVAPHPVTNAEFTKTLATALHRPAILPVPAFALRLALGDLSSLLLDSTRAAPEFTSASGYRFQHERLAGALTG